MKRCALKRKTALKADPDKIGEFVQRGREHGREGMRSAGLRRATAPSDFRDDEGRLLAMAAIPVALPRTARTVVKVPPSIRARALARSGGVCVMCLHREGIDMEALTIGALRRLTRAGKVRAATQVHHVFPRHKWPALIKVLPNLVGTCPECHDEHERAHRRFPRAVLPAETLRLADGDGPMQSYLDRTYPA